MSTRSPIPSATRKIVIQRALNRCEYCLLPATWASISHHIDHIIPLKHNGSSDIENLAYACFACNLQKGSDIAAFDPLSGIMTRLFHPRLDSWAEHFQLIDGHLVGTTALGRATAQLLQFNEPSRVRQRLLLLSVDEYTL